MIETLYGLDALDSPKAFFVALAIGLAFGFSLERAGFGSSRRLSGIFYFRDMTVLKVMFTALVVAMMGLLYLFAFGWIRSDQIHFLPSIFGAQIVGGLIFGVGFAMSGWCPGTAAVGVASGKIDAMIFLGGAVVGSILFNELYPVVGPLATLGDQGVRFAWADLGIPENCFAFLFVVAAVGAFWGSEYIERRLHGGGPYFRTPFLKAFSLALLVAAGGLFVAGGSGGAGVAATADRASQGIEPISATFERGLMEAVEAGADHMDPMELADRLLAGDPPIVVVDTRTPEEYRTFHIRGAIHIQIPDLVEGLAEHKSAAAIVLYSNGMTHPAQARDSLARLGFTNVRLLTDGLSGFVEQCLKPVSLRSEPVGEEMAAKIRAWRAHFLGGAPTAAPESSSTAQRTAALPSSAGSLPPSTSDGALPGLVDTAWLAASLGRKDLRIIDVRPQPSYNSGHIPGSVCMSPEHFRGVVKGVPAVLLPADLLARHLSLLGVRPGDTIVVVPDDKLQDATLIGMALERLGHSKYAVLDGGYSKWAEEKRPVDTVLPEITETVYPAKAGTDRFTVDAGMVLEHVRAKSAVILDTRPADYFSGAKSDEARAGRIPGSINRPIAEDLVKAGSVVKFKPIEELAKAYSALIPSKDSTVIVSCRTGHQASQTFFVLKNLLGYRSVLWYDGSWSEWASRPELPVETSGPVPARPPQEKK